MQFREVRVEGSTDTRLRWGVGAVTPGELRLEPLSQRDIQKKSQLESEKNSPLPSEMKQKGCGVQGQQMAVSCSLKGPIGPCVLLQGSRAEWFSTSRQPW